ncbi:MAG TPA: hypothetical protein VKC66_16490 [Xanthobacteraceae bacterium]|nr:hypothetical protein [Xanthobacteraceae bacterium]
MAIRRYPPAKTVQLDRAYVENAKADVALQPRRCQAGAPAQPDVEIER